MKYRLLIWDFDGTLADTLQTGLEIYNQLAERHKLVPVTDPDAVRGMSSQKFLKAHKISLFKLPRLVREFLALQKNYLTEIRVFPEIPQTLERLRRENLQLGVVSSNSEENIRTCLKANGVEDQFDFIVGFSRLFGKERALRRIVKRQRIAKQEVLYVGDEIRDIEAARRVGLDIASATWGFNTRESLAKQEPTFVFDNPTELLHRLGLEKSDSGL